VNDVKDLTRGASGKIPRTTLHRPAWGLTATRPHRLAGALLSLPHLAGRPGRPWVVRSTCSTSESESIGLQRMGLSMPSERLPPCRLRPTVCYSPIGSSSGASARARLIRCNGWGPILAPDRIHQRGPRGRQLLAVSAVL